MNNGNITTKRKTRKELAADLQINVKTMRNACRYAENLEAINRNIGEKNAKAFEGIIEKLQSNKKENISAEQVYQLSRLSADGQNKIVDRIIKNPHTAKRIINNAIPYCCVKTTVTLPSFISEWIEEEASDMNMSKSKYIEALLMTLYEKEQKNEESKHRI